MQDHYIYTVLFKGFNKPADFFLSGVVHFSSFHYSVVTLPHLCPSLSLFKPVFFVSLSVNMGWALNEVLIT